MSRDISRQSSLNTWIHSCLPKETTCGQVLPSNKGSRGGWTCLAGFHALSTIHVRAAQLRPLCTCKREGQRQQHVCTVFSLTRHHLCLLHAYLDCPLCKDAVPPPAHLHFAGSLRERWALIPTSKRFACSPEIHKEQLQTLMEFADFLGYTSRADPEASKEQRLKQPLRRVRSARMAPVPEPEDYPPWDYTAQAW